ncbi:MAG TPA: hypothetical protein PK402_06170 [Tepidisphaeraceae bacterium]|nr:hypothetical protein [Tepidisphaeraceae bacterium]
MFEDDHKQSFESSRDPMERAKEQSETLRLHAELAAIYEGTRKFDAQLVQLDAGVMRDIQMEMARLAKSRSPESPLLPVENFAQAHDLLALCDAKSLTTNDYYIHRRPGEVMLVRWLAGAEVEKFYERLQAHFDAGMSSFRTDERSGNEWKQDQSTSKYLDALDAINEKMSDRYARSAIRKLGVALLSTQTADEMNISLLADHIMGVGAEALVGPNSAPSNDADESELAWFFKLFSLRSLVNGIERMCFFTFLQKTSDEFEFDE